MGFSLLLSSLLPGIGWGDFAKLPELIRHYQEHCATTEESLSFPDFLALHYAPGSEHAQNSEHAKLPSLNTQQTWIFCPLSYTGYQLAADPVSIKLLPQPHFWLDLYSFQFHESLLHPPRVA